MHDAPLSASSRVLSKPATGGLRQSSVAREIVRPAAARPPPSKPPSHRLASFEGLRALAALVVLFGHFRLAFFQESSKAWLHSLLFRLPYLIARPIIAVLENSYNGTFAVWLFWVLSAFVLSVQFFVRNLEQTPARADRYLQESILRRYPRLCGPALASVLLAYALSATGCMYNTAVATMMGPGWGGWIRQSYHFTPSVGGALSSALWEAFFAYHRERTYNVVLWTMEKEFLGSLFLFGFLAAFGRSRARWLLYFAGCALLYALHLEWLTAFLGGALLCDLFVHRHRLAATAPFLRGSAAGRLRTSIWPAILIWLSLLVWTGSETKFASHTYLLTSLLAVGWTLFSLPSQRWLGQPLLVFLGQISYGIYLVHMPIVCSFSCWLFLRLSQSTGRVAAVGVTTVSGIGLSLLGGWLLYRLVDRPSMQIARAFSDWAVRGPRSNAPVS